ncbi:MAG: hypothetical protein MJ252_27565, partial [archaeon]|nr:hypothetical protein [archaeon]
MKDKDNKSEENKKEKPKEEKKEIEEEEIFQPKKKEKLDEENIIDLSEIESEEEIKKEKPKEENILEVEINNPQEEEESSGSSQISENSSFYEGMYLNEDICSNEYLIKNKDIINFKNYYKLTNPPEDPNEPEDDGIRYKCEICGTSKGGEFILCDNCFSAAHENCILKEEKQKLEEEYICQRCNFILSKGNDFSPLDFPCCTYCNSKIGMKGLLQKNEGNIWIHYDCNKIINNPNLKDIFRKDKKCSICGEIAKEAIKCSFKGCEEYYHYKCGLKQNKEYLYCQKHLFEMDDLILLRQKREREKGTGEEDNEKKNIF